MTKLSKFKDYLNVCYKMTEGVTVGGALIGIPVYLTRCLIGVVGTYAFYGIFATVFIGLTIDYLIYKVVRNRESLFKSRLHSSK